MYIPIAVHKNNLVLIEDMDTFALYFCSSVKQKMKPTIDDVNTDYEGMSPEGIGEGEDEFSPGYSGEDSFGGIDMHDEDDDI
ncbi:hypothetical protein CUJ83_11665 [Methanocella sp. CWC-04]|uniref:Uncharacterized protein n=1 Tax=Methanooceanicella nereidis TaxID=2052831 RepID=A0AAP2RDK3_9EURY|nr:hypothetical protein [Methanocella sp. CWC-04]MCD1295654.1 hypothetical protein [Methanocella sp. CWC-04]